MTNFILPCIPRQSFHMHIPSNNKLLHSYSQFIKSDYSQLLLRYTFSFSYKMRPWCIRPFCALDLTIILVNIFRSDDWCWSCVHIFCCFSFLRNKTPFDFISHAELLIIHSITCQFYSTYILSLNKAIGSCSVTKMST